VQQQYAAAFEQPFEPLPDELLTFRTLTPSARVLRLADQAADRNAEAAEYAPGTFVLSGTTALVRPPGAPPSRADGGNDRQSVGNETAREADHTARRLLIERALAAAHLSAAAAAATVVSEPQLLSLRRFAHWREYRRCASFGEPESSPLDGPAERLPFP